MIGDVWLCSGQSNMAFGLTSKNEFGGDAQAATTVPAANDPQMRLFVVDNKTSLGPLSDLGGAWKVCTPDSVAHFSAVAYYFGRELRTVLKRPIGLIVSAWGGTNSVAWTSLDALKKDPQLRPSLNTYEKNKANFAKNTADYPARTAAFRSDLAMWQTNVGNAFNEQMKTWYAAARQAKLAGQPLPPAPVPATPAPVPPNPPDGGSAGPSNLFNGMIAPLIPLAIKGVIWYQGEANTGRPTEYRVDFGDMITDWRQHWNEGDFPFLFVQLAAFKAGVVQSWAFLREGQLQTLALPNTGMATAIDIGDWGNVHPQDKLDVGRRLGGGFQPAGAESGCGPLRLGQLAAR